MAERQWLLPYWWDRRTSPESPAYDPIGPLRSNTTERTWTLLGALGSVGRGAVDPRGFLTTGAGCGIDWWVRANDQWHQPARAGAVRQTCVEGVPVIETRLRVGGGEVIQTVGAIAGGDGQLVIEFQNNTDAAVALAIAVRPVDLVGATRVDRVEFDGTWLVADGKRIVGFPREPGLLAGGTAAVDLATTITADDEPDAAVAPLPVTCDLGMAHAVVSLPLVHSTTVRLVAPLHLRGKHRLPSPDLSSPQMAPALDRVVSGWQAQTANGARLVLPPGRWRNVYEQARRSLRLFRIGDTFTADPIGSSAESSAGADWTTGRLIAAAHDQLAWHRESAEVLLGIAESIDRNGAIGSLSDTAAAIDAIRLHHELSGIDATTEALTEAIIGATRHLARASDARSEAHLDYLAAVGIGAASLLLEAVGENRAGSDARANVAANPPIEAIDDYEAAASCVRATPVGVQNPTLSAALAYLQRTDGAAVHRSTVPLGYDVATTAVLGAHELAVGSTAGLERLAWLVDAATTTGAWPALFHPKGAGGTHGDGHHGSSVAAVVGLFRSLMVIENHDSAILSLLPVLPQHWLGQNFEVHDAPTRFGVLSYAVRWHGKRPALLWDLTPHQNRDPNQLTTMRCPGLDANWSTTDLVGEVLLAGPDQTDGGFS